MKKNSIELKLITTIKIAVHILNRPIWTWNWYLAIEESTDNLWLFLIWTNGIGNPNKHQSSSAHQLKMNRKTPLYHCNAIVLCISINLTLHTNCSWTICSAKHMFIPSCTYLTRIAEKAYWWLNYASQKARKQVHARWNPFDILITNCLMVH